MTIKQAKEIVKAVHPNALLWTAQGRYFVAKSRGGELINDGDSQSTAGYAWKRSAEIVEGNKPGAIALQVVASYKQQRYEACLMHARKYFQARRDQPESQVEVDGRTWGGDHIVHSYNRGALLEVKGIMAFPD